MRILPCGFLVFILVAAVVEDSWCEEIFNKTSGYSIILPDKWRRLKDFEDAEVEMVYQATEIDDSTTITFSSTDANGLDLNICHQLAKENSDGRSLQEILFELKSVDNRQAAELWEACSRSESSRTAECEYTLCFKHNKKYVTIVASTGASSIETQKVLSILTTITLK